MSKGVPSEGDIQDLFASMSDVLERKVEKVPPKKTKRVRHPCGICFYRAVCDSAKTTLKKTPVSITGDCLPFMHRDNPDAMLFKKWRNHV